MIFQEVAYKLNHLRELLRELRGVLIAFSGGVDSAFLAYVAFEVLGTNAVAAIAINSEMKAI